MTQVATFHHQFLEGAEHRAHYEGLGFREKVEARLQEGERLYGDRYRAMPVQTLLREIREEGLDLGAWASLTAETLPARGVSGDELSQSRLLLQEIAAHGVMVDQLVNALSELSI